MLLYNKNGQEIPMVGLGTFPFQGRVMADAVINASKIGYRLFDTADDYYGESGIGIALKELNNRTGLLREDLFLQTKISDNNATANEPLKGIYFNPSHIFMKRHTVDEIVREKVENSLFEMNTDYIDSLLIHYPFPDYIVEIWKTMIDLKKEGKVRYIGVSNFHENHINKLIEETGVCPEINEIYISPIGTKQQLVDFCKNHNCLISVYSPLMDLASNRIPLSQLQTMSNKYGKSIAQLLIRWNIDRGCMPLPKSSSIIRLRENFDVFDFSLTKEDMSIISGLNQDYQYIVESKTCPGI